MTAMTTSYFLIPVIAAAIGWCTNVVAVKMLFHPRQPMRLFGWKLQGLIPRRQAALAGSLADIFEKELVSDEELMDRLLQGDIGPHAEKMLDSRMDSFVASIGEKIPLASMFLTGSLVDTLRDSLKTEILSGLPDLQKQLVGQPVGIRGLVEEKIRAFSLPKLESIVMSVASRELRSIELLGGLLGFLIGLVQVAILSL
jgi:uncharacterized membrane protein YheB (UPF0754 family)